MTREEAIKILSNHEMIDVMWDKADEALNMAIDALEQEPCEDCISREEAIKISNWLVDNMDICEALKKLPSVQPTPRKGKWIKGEKTLICPICGAKGENIESDFVFDYCPCCGSDMRESEVSDEEEK